jgi:hypothetical protein
MTTRDRHAWPSECLLRSELALRVESLSTALSSAVRLVHVWAAAFRESVDGERGHVDQCQTPASAASPARRTVPLMFASS